MIKSIIILSGLMYVFSVSHGGNSVLLQNKTIKPCLHLKKANDTARESWVDFLLIRGAKGEPDKIRLMDMREVNKILAKVAAAHDYAKCLEDEIIKQEARRKGSI